MLSVSVRIMSTRLHYSGKCIAVRLPKTVEALRVGWLATFQGAATVVRASPPFTTQGMIDTILMHTVSTTGWYRGCAPGLLQGRNQLWSKGCLLPMQWSRLGSNSYAKAHPHSDIPLISPQPRCHCDLIRPHRRVFRYTSSGCQRPTSRQQSSRIHTRVKLGYLKALFFKGAHTFHLYIL